jgi:hypothetical protein
MPERTLLRNEDEVPDAHQEPVLDILRSRAQPPGVEAMAPALDIDQLGVGGVAEVADNQLALDLGPDGPVEIHAVTRRFRLAKILAIDAGF